MTEIGPQGFRLGYEYSLLTYQEREAARELAFDLAAGYPRVTVPRPVRRAYQDPTAMQIALEMPPAWQPGRRSRLENGLALAVSSFLNVPPPSPRIVYPALTGTVALDRAIAGVQALFRTRRQDALHVIISSPCVDFLRVLLSDRARVTVSYASDSPEDAIGAPAAAQILERMKALPQGAPLVILTSPVNPTGATWSRDELRKVGSAIAERRGILLVDHAFLSAGVQVDDVPAVWDVAREIPGLTWVAVWDTGKTFGLNEDKLGFILCDDGSLATAIDGALSVVQFDVSRRLQLLVAEVLQWAAETGYRAWLGDVCRSNLETLRSAVSKRGIDVLSPQAGSLALIDVTQMGQTSEQFSTSVKQSGVGVVAANDFFHGRTMNRQLVRVALARDTDYFHRAAEALARACSVEH